MVFSHWDVFSYLFTANFILSTAERKQLFSDHVSLIVKIQAENNDGGQMQLESWTNWTRPAYRSFHAFLTLRQHA